MRAFPCWVIGVFLVINGQALAQGPGFADGFTRGWEQGERLRMQRERFQMEHKLTRERMRQMELENQLRLQERQSRVREHEMMFQGQQWQMRQMERETPDHQRALSDPTSHGSRIEPRPPTPPDEH